MLLSTRIAFRPRNSHADLHDLHDLKANPRYLHERHTFYANQSRIYRICGRDHEWELVLKP